ncbi:MAG TPA: DUF4912 domain-containing protein [Polyangiaceae bacterium]|jgi:hypothetical protein
MNRADLERLDRGVLIERAEAAGVTRARILTRPELIDELLIRDTPDEAARERVRGFFGKARDLVARVVERGLHLPDAADRIRTLGSMGLPARRSSAPIALPTVTLAEIYAAQGHRERAVDTLESVLAREPDHAAARALLAQLEDADYPVPPPRMPPERDETAASAWPVSDDAEPLGSMPSSHGARPSGASVPAAEPAHLLDDAPLPLRYDVDECVAIPVDPRTLYVYWEVRDKTIDYVRVTRPRGEITLRLVVIVPTWDGPRSSIVDHEAASLVGDHFARDLPAGCVVRAAIGWKHGDAFLPIAHSPALENPPGAPSPLVADVLVRWTPDGVVPVSAGDRDAVVIERALGRIRQDDARVWRGQEVVPTDGLGGSSERWVNAPSS